MTALVFSGQGAQKPGMGRDLYEKNENAKKVFDLAPAFVREQCFSGTEETLSQTHITQPCVYTVSIAAFEVFRAAGIDYDMVAGFSLGEYAALTAAGIFDFASGLSLVTQRGKWMSECASEGSGMAAVLGKRESILEFIGEISGEGMLLPVNYNSPSQTVVAGSGERYQNFLERAPLGKLKVIPLKVSGAFHSPMMRPASEKIRKLLDTMQLAEPTLPVYSNVTGENMQGADLRDLVARQTMSPVLWEQTVGNMIRDGADTFVEIGVGNTLCGLIKKIDRSVRTFQVNSSETLEKTVSALKGGNA